MKGDAYEGLLQKNAEDVKDGAGQCFTPRTLIAAMVDAVAPQPGQTICDPACGTGGFLLAAHDYIARHHALDREQKKRLKSGTLYGIELVDSVARLCCMNLLVHGSHDRAVTHHMAQRARQGLPLWSGAFVQWRPRNGNGAVIGGTFSFNPVRKVRCQAPGERGVLGVAVGSDRGPWADRWNSFRIEGAQICGAEGRIGVGWGGGRHRFRPGEEIIAEVAFGDGVTDGEGLGPLRRVSISCKARVPSLSRLPGSAGCFAQRAANR
ncbi:MAG TPA: N-6 DNA methylase [Verrucomicrobiae bacterium]